MAATVSLFDDEAPAPRRKKATQMGQLLLSQAGSTAPISSPLVGVAKLAAGALGGLVERAEEMKAEKNRKALVEALMGLSSPSASTATPASQAPTQPTTGVPGANAPNLAPTMAPTRTSDAAPSTSGERADVAALKAALGPMESGGRYGIKGPYNAKYGFPLGKYQVMESNLPEWSQAALGRRVTSDEYLKNPDLQEQIAGHRMGLILDKYGNLQDAASVWHSGRPLAIAKAAGARDVNMSTADYVAKTVGNLTTPQVQVAAAPPPLPPVREDVPVVADAAPNAPVAAVAPSPDWQTAQATEEQFGAQLAAANPQTASMAPVVPTDIPLPPPRPAFADAPAPAAMEAVGTAPPPMQHAIAQALMQPDLSNMNDAGAGAFARANGNPQMIAQALMGGSAPPPSAAPVHMAQALSGPAPVASDAAPMQIAPQTQSLPAPASPAAQTAPAMDPRRAAIAQVLMNPEATAGIQSYALGLLDPKPQTATVGNAIIDLKTGRPIYQAPEKPEIELREHNGRLIEYDKRSRQSRDVTPEGLPSGYRPMSPDERKTAGVPDDVPAFVGPDGKPQFGPAASRVTVNNAVNPIIKGVGEQFVEDRSAAKGAGEEIRSIHAARQELDRGIISGQGADLRLSLAKIGNAFGLTNEQAANTEVFRSTVAGRVLNTVKGLGAGSGISNADREFAEKMAGGQISLEPASLSRLLDIGERAARERITRYNSQAGKMLESMPDLKPYGGALNVEMPPEYQRQTAPTGTVAVQTPDEARKLPPGTRFRTPDGREFVR